MYWSDNFMAGHKPFCDAINQLTEEFKLVPLTDSSFSSWVDRTVGITPPDGRLTVRSPEKMIFIQFPGILIELKYPCVD